MREKKWSRKIRIYDFGSIRVRIIHRNDNESLQNVILSWWRDKLQCNIVNVIPRPFFRQYLFVSNRAQPCDLDKLIRNMQAQ